MHPELVQNAGIALILFLQGLSMPLEQVRKGARNWKLHVIIQAFTFLIHAAGKTGSSSFGPLLLEITMLTLIPFAGGVGLRSFIRQWVDANKKWVNRISNGVILFFVYSAFCDSVKEKIWHEYGLLLTAQILLGVIALFGTVSLLIYVLIFGSRNDLSLIFLPIMFYHPFQLFTNGLLANHWAKIARQHSRIAPLQN